MAIAGTLYVINGFRALRSFQFFLRRTFLLSWELQEAYGHARELAHTDSLTGLNNRRAFTGLAEKALALSHRHARPASVVMFDVDHFKRINDAHGHAAGDRVLQEVAEVIRRVVRGPDIAGRLGGEEFAVLLPETNGLQAAVLAERLREAIGQVSVTFEGTTISFSCSFGVAATAPDVTTFDPLLSRADQALYRAKRQGRNRVSLDQLVTVRSAERDPVVPKDR
jgi:diguanylate cyclase (GGDEF)-like protein